MDALRFPQLLAFRQTVESAPIRARARSAIANGDQVERVSGKGAAVAAKLDAVSQRILETTSDLVRIPSQGGIDEPGPICAALLAKLAEVGLTGRVLMQGTRPVGVVAEIVGKHPGPTYALNAVVDTAPVGDANRWSTLTPFSAELRGNRLVGRGVGDSKVAAAMFIEVGRALAQRRDEMHGRAVLFFDAAEHAGDFAGMRAFVDSYGGGPERVQGMVIGYPGNESLQIGSRGFHRTQWRMGLRTPGSMNEAMTIMDATFGLSLPEGRSLEFPLATKRSPTAVSCEKNGDALGPGTVVSVIINGKGGHTGASGPSGVNAVSKALVFMDALQAHGRTFFGESFVPTLTGLRGGKDFSVVPDQVELEFFVPKGIAAESCEHIARLACASADEVMPAPLASKLVAAAADVRRRGVTALTLNIDVRTTPACDIDAIDALVEKRVAELNARAVDCQVRTVGAWPAFRLPDGSQLSQAMQKAINAHATKPVQPRISGPSNAGNVAAAFGIPATAGFGVTCKHMHATDESIDVTTIPVAYAVHLEAMQSLFKMGAGASVERVLEPA